MFARILKVKYDRHNKLHISMLSYLLFERLVYKQFQKQLQSKLCSEQHGFKKYHPTITKLLLQRINVFHALDGKTSRNCLPSHCKGF